MLKPVTKALPLILLALFIVACGSNNKENKESSASTAEENLDVEAKVTTTDDSGHYILAGNLTRREQLRIKADLRYLSQIESHMSFNGMDKLFDFTEANNLTLNSWLADRVKYIVANSMDLDNSLVETKETMVYENPQIVPDAILDAYPALKDRGFREESKGIMVAANVGALVYIIGKVQGSTVVGLDIPYYGVVPVKSSRVGLVQAGPGYSMSLGDFSSRNPKLEFGSDPINNLESEGNIINRLGTLFHEARHSDGSGKHIGFMHVKCPEGHDFAGIPACDGALNGAYSVGAAATVVLAKQCKNCSALEMSKLKLEIVDSLNRVIKLDEKTPENYWETKPEGHR